jgi:flagellin-like protein
MKILKNKKALSPVVASIILIAVTVAVSIAVAAWMGALSFSFMSSGEQLQLGNPWNWDTTAPVYSVYINVTNGGSSTIVISSGRIDIDGNQANITAIWLSSSATASLTIPKGERACVMIDRSAAFAAGTAYTFTIVTGNNKEFAVTGVAQGS